MRVIDMEDIILAMRNQTQFVLRCEEVFHDKISAAAAAVLSAQPKKPFVCLTGPSGSGKTTTAMRLKAYLENLGVCVCLLSMDNFFLSLDQRPPEAEDWESPYCVNWNLLLDCIDGLAAGKTVQVPWYDFKTGSTGGFRPMTGSDSAVVIAEGIHMLNPIVFDQVRSRATGVYVATILGEDTVCVTRLSVRSPSTRANANTSSRTSRTPASTSIRSTITSFASLPRICGSCHSSPKIWTMCSFRRRACPY